MMQFRDQLLLASSRHGQVRPHATDLLYSGMMVFIRAGGLIALLPVFSGQSAPVQIRLAIAVLLAYLGAPVRLAPAVPTDAIGLITVAVRELFIGLLMGFTIRLVFYAVEFAGQVMSTEIGLTRELAD